MKVDWVATAKALDSKSPLDGMDHVSGITSLQLRKACDVLQRLPFLSPPQALKTFGNEIGIAFSGAEDVALIEYAKLTGRPFRVFRWVDIL